MSDPQPQRRDLLRLAAYLHGRVDAILQSWREAVDADPTITAAATLARAQFVDHVPRILAAFEEQLRARGEAEQEAAADAQREGAADHGVHRWLHGYHYRETMREWGHLQLCLSKEVEAFTLSEANLDANAMSTARCLMTRLFVECMVESASGHVRLLEIEASSRLRDLEQVLSSVRALERERAQLWHEAAHDLRGNAGAVRLAASVLARAPIDSRAPDAVRSVERTAQALTSLLDDLIELTRLEAGRERRKIAAFDAATLVRELSTTFDPLAAERGLSLRVEIPAALPVSGDANKVRRILQNLLLNALKYTERGGVIVNVSELQVGDAPSWEVLIQDTGIGIADRSSPAIARLLRVATREGDALAAEATRTAPDPLPTLRSQSVGDGVAPPGEGVGLTIVKRLCEPLDATIECDTAPARGTTFRLVFPCRYDVESSPQPAT
jgi:signal transduction histidine kinase